VGGAYQAETIRVGETTGSETRVLIVDDDLGFGRAASEMLAARGYTVVGHATTADQAVRECDRLHPDAVLLDVRLPDANGVTFAETLGKARAQLKILLGSPGRRPGATAAERRHRICSEGRAGPHRSGRIPATLTSLVKEAAERVRSG
jgi:CheY-like chemotaxis protein